jgi:thiol:disulfide interchange protein
MPRKKHRQPNKLPQILVVAGLILLVIMIMVVKNQSAPPAEAASGETLQVQFTRALADKRPVLAFYHSLDCDSCQQMMAVVAQVHPQFADEVVLIDVDVYDRDNASLLRSAAIRAIPTQVFYRRNGESQVVVGVMSADQLRQVLSDLAEGG